MPIDRTWFNNLVDDDGSGTTGTPWNKATINGQLNAIDGMVPTGTFQLTLVGTGGGTPTYTARSGAYAKSGNVLQAGGRVTLSSKGSLAGTIILRGFPYISNANAQQGALWVPFYGGLAISIASLGGYVGNGSSDIVMTYTPAAGGMSTPNLDAAHIGNAFDMLFAVQFVTNV